MHKKKCKFCGKVFNYYISNKNRKYCSLNCAYKETGREISKTKKRLFKEKKIKSWNEGINHKKKCKICNKMFQYYPSQEKKAERKYCSRVCMGKDNLGVKKWEGSRKGMSWLNDFKFKKGRISHNKGKLKENYKPLKIAGENISLAFKKNKNLSINISKRMREGGAIKARRANNFSPNKPEKELIKFFNYWKLPLKFVGDGKKWFKKGNKYFNPDFIDEKNEIIIEFDGKYWHKDKKELDELRNETYRDSGYKVLLLNEDDLNNKIILMNKIGGLCLY